MRKHRWLLLPAALLWLSGYEAQSLDRCLAETTVECALDGAVDAARQIKLQYERAVAYAYIARVEAGAGMPDAARQHLGEVKLLKREVPGPALRDGISANQARVRAMLGEFGEALDMAEGIRDPVAAVRAWTWIAENQAKAGDNASADRSLERALAAAAELGPAQMAFPMAMMAIVRVRQGAFADGLAAAKAARAIASDYDEVLWQVRVASLVAVAEAAAGKKEQAHETIQQAVRNMHGMVEGGASAKEHMSALAYVAWAKALSGDEEGAQAELDQLKMLIDDFPDHFWRSISLSAIALVLAKAE